MNLYCNCGEKIISGTLLQHIQDKHPTRNVTIRLHENVKEIDSPAQGMRNVLVAFDVDGTLAQNGALEKHEIVANERIRTLLIIMAHMKNTTIMVWSGGGELWARQAAKQLGVDKYVDKYADKHLLGRTEAGHPIFDPLLKPDIAIDDIQSCELGLINLIVREK